MYNRGVTTSSPYLFPSPTPWHSPTTLPAPVPPPVDPRPLPPGWTQSYDRSTNHYFYTDTNINPFKSFWEHPGDLGYDPGIYGRRFTYDEVLAARERGYRISHGIEWLRNLRVPREAKVQWRWREVERRGGSEDDDDEEEEGVEEREDRRRRRRRKGGDKMRIRPRSRSRSRLRTRYQASEDDDEDVRPHSPPRASRIERGSSEEGYYSGESAAESSGTQRVYSTGRDSTSGETSRTNMLNSHRTDHEISSSTPRPTEAQEQSRSQSQSQDHTPGQSQSLSTSQALETIPERPTAEEPTESQGPTTTTPQTTTLEHRDPPLGQEQRQAQPERIYAASEFDFPTIPQGGIYLIPRALNPWIEPAIASAATPIPPPPPHTSPAGSIIGRSRDIHTESFEFGFTPNNDNNNQQQQRQPQQSEESQQDRDMTFYMNLNRGEGLGHRGRVSPRSPPASPIRVGSARIMRTTASIHDDNQTLHSAGTETEFTENTETQSQYQNHHEDRSEIDFPPEPPTLIDRFRKALHLHVPTPSEKSAKREFKNAQRESKEAEIAHRNQRRYQAAADRMRKQSELLNEMNRRQSAIYHSQTLKDKLGFDEEVFRKKIIEGTLMNKPSDAPTEKPSNENVSSVPSSAPSEPSGSHASLPNPVGLAADAFDTSMPGNLQPSPNAPIGMAVDAEAETRRAKMREDLNINKLRTPAPSPPRFYGQAPQMVPDTLYRRHAHDLSRATGREPFLRENWARHHEEIDPRYGAFGSGRFGAGSPAAVRWQIGHRGFQRPPNRPSIFGGDTRRHPHYFDYAEYDEHEWDGGGGYRGAGLNCGW
ncbi:hypothetical protein TWF192_007838 [Orbilia oligospora]|nr:hypothetical protein TWF192_007838 [Orbilia oligospora]